MLEIYVYIQINEIIGDETTMKKTMMLITILLFTAGCTKQTTNSTKQTSDSSTTAISSTSVSSSSASAAPTSTETVEATVSSEPVKETTEQSASVSEQPAPEASDTTPQSLRGTWIGNNGEQDLEVTITTNSIITNGQTYKITSYTESNNTFTLLWDTADASSGNPQPFIYTYIPETDGMTNGVDFHRK